MNTKKLAIFGASGVVLAGILVYALGIYPPASSRDGRGAIGQRNVYRADQPADASVNPNDAPVATADELKNAVTLQNGQMFALSNGVKYQVQNNQVVALQSGVTYQMNDGIKVRMMQDGFLYKLNDGVVANQVKIGQVVSNGQIVALQSGALYKMASNGQMLALQSNLQNNLIVH